VAELNTPIDTAPRSTAARIGWIILIIATLYVCYFSHLSAIGFVGPDEPRYAWIARDMAESGDWVTPRLYGKPWFEKPVLYYWSAAVFFKLSGVQRIPPGSTASVATNPTPRFSAETAARLPSAIYALLATLALAWLALRIYGPETARWFLLLLPTTVGMIGFSHAAATDMPFFATLTIAMVFAAILLRLVPSVDSPTYSVSSASPLPVRAGLAPPADATRTNLNAGKEFPAPPSLTSFFFGLFLGLAVLAKGPAAIILSGGAVFFWALFTKRWRDAFRLFHPIGIISFCLTALPWYILCASRNPDFFRVFIIEHNFKRYLTPEFQHIQPFWYYIPVLLVAFFPWTILLIWSLVAGARHLLQKKSISPATLFLLTWSAFCILFFSTSHSKLPGYILPAFPAVALLLCHFSINHAFKWRKPIGGTLLVFAGLSFILASVITGVHLGGNRDWKIIQPAILVIAAMTFVTNAVLAYAFLGKHESSRRGLFFALSAIPVFVVLLGSGGFLTAMNPIWSPARALANQIQLQNVPSSKFRVLSNLSRGTHYSINFYLYSEIEEWNPADLHSEQFVLSGAKHCGKLSSDYLACSEISLGPGAEGRWLLHLTPHGPTSPSSPSLAVSPKNK
jgi:4-amino-4-deoxy-L-arabinose transferase-like glycosyltransferase